MIRTYQFFFSFLFFSLLFLTSPKIYSSYTQRLQCNLQGGEYSEEVLDLFGPSYGHPFRHPYTHFFSPYCSSLVCAQVVDYFRYTHRTPKKQGLQTAPLFGRKEDIFSFFPRERGISEVNLYNFFSFFESACLPSRCHLQEDYFLELKVIFAYLQIHVHYDEREGDLSLDLKKVLASRSLVMMDDLEKNHACYLFGYREVICRKKDKTVLFRTTHFHLYDPLLGLNQTRWVSEGELRKKRVKFTWVQKKPNGKQGENITIMSNNPLRTQANLTKNKKVPATKW